jgi:hypothetical protein
MSQCLNTQSNRNTKIPLVRFELTSPYFNPITGQSTNITEQQLNMRRKVEILKYSSNRVPTQTNSLTKKQKWAMLVSQNTSRGRQYASECPPDISVKIPTSSSDVPGPVMLLYEDPSIPLYNYIITRSYAYNIPNPNGYWDTVVNTNVALYNRSGAGIFTLNILPNINRETYTYYVSTPIAIHAQGKFKTGQTAVTALTINIKTAILYVYCNGINIPTLTKTITDLNILKLKFTQSNVNTRDFNITQVVGTLNFSNIVLNMSPLYSFDFGLSVEFELFLNNSTTPLTTFSNTSIDTLQYNSYANITSVVPIVNTNCVVNIPGQLIAITEPSIFGI